MVEALGERHLPPPPLHQRGLLERPAMGELDHHLPAGGLGPGQVHLGLGPVGQVSHQQVAVDRVSGGRLTSTDALVVADEVFDDRAQGDHHQCSPSRARLRSSTLTVRSPSTPRVRLLVCLAICAVTVASGQVAGLGHPRRLQRGVGHRDVGVEPAARGGHRVGRGSSPWRRDAVELAVGDGPLRARCWRRRRTGPSWSWRTSGRPTGAMTGFAVRVGGHAVGIVLGGERVGLRRVAVQVDRVEAGDEPDQAGIAGAEVRRRAGRRRCRPRCTASEGRGWKYWGSGLPLASRKFWPMQVSCRPPRRCG